jgi:type I restriction enzyme S subunit
MSFPVPAGWTTVNLGDIGDALIGLTYQPSSVRLFGTLVLRSSNIQDNELSFEDNVYVNSAIPDQIRVRDGDILICVRNGSRALIGKSARLDERVVGETFGAFMAVFRSNANEYLHYYFQSDVFKQQVDQHLGATINQITNASLKSFTVTLPPPDERARIVSQLRNAAALVSALQRLLAKKRDIKQGIAQALLTGRFRLPGFSASWDVVRFDRTVVQVKEKALPADIDSRSTLVELEHIESASGRLIASATAATAVSHKTVFQPGDVLFGRLRSYLRKYWLADRPGLCSTEIWVLRPTHLATGAFLRYLVATERFVAAATGGYGTHMPRADWNVVRRLEVSLPPPDEQKAIADALADADAEIDVLRQRLEKAKAIKEGMAQQLLTGRVRLLDLEAVA